MNADDSERWLEEALAAPPERIAHDNFAERVLAALPPRRQRSWVTDFLVSGAAALAVTLLLVILPAGRAALAAVSEVLAPLGALVSGANSALAAAAQLSTGGLIVGMAALCLGAGFTLAVTRSD